ncbi:nucleotide pyrophosphohydrolase [Larkinella punicea]|uniref:Nucleotide pyrophosphohydrolase n=1 Tax=Larkinella punicea TaxID=2315727 RepID=A0A368JIN6_9BACT|nr:nucleotide pyrophosphohydrolase [Larkinella punicea]RCR67519.1 nucleotide pyrophosphohydrolase [Larkinella punicea]
MKAAHFFDSAYSESEQIPKYFTVSFEEIKTGEKQEVRVVLNNKQVGDVINDNSYKNDFYRYHDVFHYSFATLLGWSPCTRVLVKCKRKSNNLVDEVEDGARAAITEEALSMIIFNEAKRKNYFKDVSQVSKTTLRIIKEMTENFEVKVRTKKQWENAILKAYEVFRFLIANNGGKVEFNAIKKEINYESLS